LSNQKAVIDIGTNTINLLIASQQGGKLVSNRFERIPAHLGRGGMQQGVLTPEAMGRGLDALRTHLATCKEKGVEIAKTTATSAVRSCSNGQVFVDRVFKELGLAIEIISGDREAELIWKGVRLTGLLDSGPAIIMDVGGGSTEFILADALEIVWKKSYMLGVTRLRERFEASDPFTAQQEVDMRTVIHQELHELWSHLDQHPCDRLIGASGSFNSVSMMLAGAGKESIADIHEPIDIAAYDALSQRLRSSNEESRRAYPGLVPDRVKTMPYSALLMDVVIDSMPALEMHRSSYALKEGLLSEVFTI